MYHLTEILKDSILAVYIAILVAVALYGAHRYVLVYLYVKHKKDGYVPQENFIALPRITVQLPMYNEHVISERVIKAACLLDYPLDRLEIQVLDDSTDESAAIAERCVNEWAEKGYPVKYIHRTNRVGYK